MASARSRTFHSTPAPRLQVRASQKLISPHRLGEVVQMMEARRIVMSSVLLHLLCSDCMRSGLGGAAQMSRLEQACRVSRCARRELWSMLVSGQACGERGAELTH